MKCKHGGSLHLIPCVFNDRITTVWPESELDVDVCEPTDPTGYTGMLWIPNRNTSFVQAHSQFWPFSINTWWKAIGGSSSTCYKKKKAYITKS